jgi:hypothetical protein
MRFKVVGQEKGIFIDKENKPPDLQPPGIPATGAGFTEFFGWLP